MKIMCLNLVGLAVGLGFLGVGTVRGGDLTTLSGTTYREVSAVRVEPDGVTWRHANGVAKVDFADSPEAIRQAYHYDAKKAVAYHEAQVQAQAVATEQTGQILREHETRQRAHLQAVAAAGVPTTNGNGFSYRRDGTAGVSLAERVLGEQIDAFKVKQAATAEETGGLGDQRLWNAAPKLKTSTVAADLAGGEYRASLHHAAGGFPATSGQDNFFQPDYQTHDYYKEVDRSNALLANKGF